MGMGQIVLLRRASTGGRPACGRMEERMSLKTWVSTPKIRRGLATAAVVLAAGGLVLFRADAATTTDYLPRFPPTMTAPAGATVATFAGPGVHGTFALSQSNVLARGSQQLFADVTMVAD